MRRRSLRLQGMNKHQPHALCAKPHLAFLRVSVGVITAAVAAGSFATNAPSMLQHPSALGCFFRITPRMNCHVAYHVSFV